MQRGCSQLLGGRITPAAVVSLVMMGATVWIIAKTLMMEMTPTSGMDYHTQDRPLRMRLSKEEVVSKFHIPEEALELAIKVEDGLMQDGVPTGLAAMIQRLDPVKLTARRAFVAYNGVISIIYDGWPPQVETLQETIERRLGEMHGEEE